MCREHGRRSQRPSGCRRPGHAESGAAGSAATTVSLRGALVGRAVHTVACKRHCVPLRVAGSRDPCGGSRNPRRGHPQCRVSRACPQERALPRYKPRRGPQSVCVAVVVRCSVGACLRWAVKPSGCVIRPDVSRRCALPGSQRLEVHGRCRTPCRCIPPQKVVVLGHSLGIRLEPVRVVKPGGCAIRPTSPVVALPQAPPRGKSLGGGAASDTAAALPSGGTVSIHEPGSGEFAVWVVLLIVTDPRDTRAGRLQDSPTTRCTQGWVGSTTGAKRQTARRHTNPTHGTVSKHGGEQSRVPFSTLRTLFRLQYLPPRHKHACRHTYITHSINALSHKVWRRG